MAEQGAQETQRPSAILQGTRYGLPALVALAGLIIMCLGGENDLEGGAMIIGAGLAIYFINWLFRIGVSGESEREAERLAREYFDVHGHWPDERPRPAPRSLDRPPSAASIRRHPPRRSREHR
jgi:hypothetical protein